MKRNYNKQAKERAGKKYHSKKNYRREDSELETTRVDSKRNDASWYTRNQALVADGGKIAFTWPTGIPVSLEFPNPNAVDYLVNGRAGDKLLMPGVMALSYVPTYGTGHDGYDPLNIAAQNIYTYVRHVQSGHSNYDPNDLMMYLMAMDQVYSLYMHLVRAYGTLRLFSQKNRNFPRVILNAMGFDYDDLANNLADFRYYINNAAARIGAMVVPNCMPIFLRHMWMSSGIYTDGPSAKAQMYIFRPQCFGEYNEKTSNTGAFLDPHFMAYKHTVADWCQLLDTLIGAIRASEDCGIISGDLLKAYGEQVIKLPDIIEDYQVTVEYSPEVLGQIANATVMPEAVYATVGSITPMVYQDLTTNTLKSALVFNDAINSSDTIDGYQPYLGKRVMVGLSEQPTPEEVMVNSRLMVIADTITAISSNAVEITAASLGSEVVVEAGLYDTENLEGFYNVSGHAMAKHRYAKYIMPYNQYGTANVVQGLAVMNYFNLHPCFNQVRCSGTLVYVNTFFDVDNYAIIDAHDIAKMHDTALLSMLDVPLLGKSK